MKREQPPIAIVVTWGKEMIEANGGLLRFIRHLEHWTRDENSGFWYHKCKNRPQQEIAHVYVICCNRVAYRFYYGGHESGETIVFKATGEYRSISWPRLVLAGPFEKAPHKIPMRGFQGFRYIYEPIF